MTAARVTYPGGDTLTGTPAAMRREVAAFLRSTGAGSWCGFECIEPGRLWHAGGGAAPMFVLRLDPIEATG